MKQLIQTYSLQIQLFVTALWLLAGVYTLAKYKEYIYENSNKDGEEDGMIIITIVFGPLSYFLYTYATLQEDDNS